MRKTSEGDHTHRRLGTRSSVLWERENKRRRRRSACEANVRCGDLCVPPPICSPKLMVCLLLAHPARPCVGVPACTPGSLSSGPPLAFFYCVYTDRLEWMMVLLLLLLLLLLVLLIMLFNCTPSGGTI